MDEFNKVPDVRVMRFSTILRGICNLTEGRDEKRETLNEATKRTVNKLIAQGDES
jgi:hypothetical protein